MNICVNEHLIGIEKMSDPAQNKRRRAGHWVGRISELNSKTSVLNQ